MHYSENVVLKNLSSVKLIQFIAAPAQNDVNSAPFYLQQQ